MTRLTFPFWMVTTRLADIPVLFVPPKHPSYVAVFPSAESATAYMIEHGEPRWELSPVTKATFQTVIRTLRLLGVKGLVLDPPGAGALLDLDDIRM